MDPKDIIRQTVINSTDEVLKRQKNLKSTFLRHIHFSDIMDIVLYLIRLQSDWGKISMIDTYTFFKLVKEVWFQVPEKMQRIFKNSIPYWHEPWEARPGPMGGCASIAEVHAQYEAGYLCHDRLLMYLGQPDGMLYAPGITFGNWPKHFAKHIKTCVFPKFRRKYNTKKLEAIFTFGEKLIQKLREEAREKSDAK